MAKTKTPPVVDRGPGPAEAKVLHSDMLTPAERSKVNAAADKARSVPRS